MNHEIWRELKKGGSYQMGLRDGLVVKVLRLALLLGSLFYPVLCNTHNHVFVVEAAPYTRLCRMKNILTVNGQFPGPTLYVHKGDTLVVDVYNHADQNVTLHWHGVKQPRNPWSDGPEYITQCPIQPRAKFSYTIILSMEEGTVWWHAHSDWTRATVHGAIVVLPKPERFYPFPKPTAEYIIILGEWWIKDVNEVLEEALETGAEPEMSDAYTINGQPGYLFPCSKSGTFRMHVEHGKTYLLRVINAAMSSGLFFSVAHHRLTLVGTDGSYTKPLTTDYIMITPGETMDLLLEANQPPTNLYFMAARALNYQNPGDFDNTTTTAILEYSTNTTQQLFPSLPYYNDTEASINFTSRIRSLANIDHPISVPLIVRKQLIITISVNELACPDNSCLGPNGTRLSASLNNISFVNPSIDVLRAYYKSINGVFGKDFPNRPPLIFNFTADDQPLSLLLPRLGREVKVFGYNASVEVVFQGTSLVLGENHPMHLHGYSFYVVGWGFGNFDKKRDPLGYNLIDPPLKNTVGVPRNGWAAIRFKASNPGVWFLHCHLERHLTFGMNTVFIVKNGANPANQILPPPPYLPPC